MKKFLFTLPAVLISITLLFSTACSFYVDKDNGGTGQDITGTDDDSGSEEKPGNDSDSGQGEDKPGDNTENEDPPAPKVEKQKWLDEMPLQYSSIGHGSLAVNEDANGNSLSLYKDEQEQQHEHGFFAHAYSVLLFEELETQGFTAFETYIGINGTARVNNTQTSVQFRIYVDDQPAYVSDTFGAYSEEEYVKIDITDADRLTLVADSLGGNGNDHAVWADCKLTYYDDIKPNLRADDIEFPSPWQVTEANILQNAAAYAADGRDLSGQIQYETNYKPGQTGEFSLTYRVSDGKTSAEKTVSMKVLSGERFRSDADSDYLSQPFADYVYYGRKLLSFEGRKAYDLIMEELLRTNISDSSRTTYTVDLQAHGIYISPAEAKKLKPYLIYDEARLYFLYYWRESETGGVTVQTEGGFAKTITFKLYNGDGQYYSGQDNFDVYAQAEESVGNFFDGLTEDMSDAQLLSAVQNKYRATLTYSNENYADTFYGSFITRRTICSGYSKGYAYLAQRLGVQTAYAVGYAGGAHAWNYMRVGGNWYMTDTTWGTWQSFGLLGKEYMQSSGRYDYGNYSKMPELSQTNYDKELIPYPLFSILPSKLLLKGSSFEIEDLVVISASMAQKAPVVSVEYEGTFDLSRAGNYTVDITAKNSLGNVVRQSAEIFVADSSEKLSQFTPQMSGKSSYAYRAVSLYRDGEEISYTDGLYIKANGTISLDYDISGKGYKYFTANIGVDKVIRDNVDWGWQAKATFEIYADGVLLYSRKDVGWKANESSVAVKIPEGTQTLTLRVTDNTGQGGTGWGDCLLYR